MKQILCALALGTALVTGAQAADVYQRGSTKDAPDIFSSGPEESNHTGLTVRLFLGYALINREQTQRVDREFGGVETIPTGTEQAEIDEALAELNAAGIDASVDGNKFIVPLIRTILGTGDDSDTESFVGGGEIEYLVQRGRFAFGLVAAATFYGNGDSRKDYDGVPSQWAGGSVVTPHGSSAIGEDSFWTSTGFMSVERKLDIDLAAKVGIFVTNNTMLYALAGPSFSKATLRGESVSTQPGFDASYKEDDWSIGYVVGAGVQHYFTPNLVGNIQGDYRQHSYEASGNHDTSNIESGTYNHTGIKGEAEDSVWTVKAGLGYKF